MAGATSGHSEEPQRGDEESKYGQSSPDLSGWKLLLKILRSSYGLPQDDDELQKA
ncbi:MAG: hypothetical protein JW893_06010 [Candidatus Omnitrophica bacterium]|nr:hypothetical protein [Candidatus Omnitrophota bacterium]